MKQFAKKHARGLLDTWARFKWFNLVVLLLVFLGLIYEPQIRLAVRVSQEAYRNFQQFNHDRIDRALLDNPDVRFIYDAADRSFDTSTAIVPANCEGERLDMVVFFFNDTTLFLYQNNGEIAHLSVPLGSTNGGTKTFLPDGKALDIGTRNASSCDGLLVLNLK